MNKKISYRIYIDYKMKKKKQKIIGIPKDTI